MPKSDDGFFGLDLDIEGLRWELRRLGVGSGEAWDVLDVAQRDLAAGDPESAGVLVKYATEIVATLAEKRSASARAAAPRSSKKKLFDQEVMKALAKWKRKPTRREFALHFACDRGIPNPRLSDWNPALKEQKAEWLAFEQRVYRVLRRRLGPVSPHPWQPSKTHKV